jgi:hypothetical protein
VNNSLANFVYRVREGKLLCHNMSGLGLGDRDGDLRSMHLPLAFEGVGASCTPLGAETGSLGCSGPRERSTHP